ncbi:magnesium transporter CorA family protein [Cohnella cholangitidis]|uniref:CorA-like Mg2+ transporter protein n=1 Tax=Cohnella cholangitidis TaxID=2598458 RepID=A0A7G5BYV3_9BACL|nr:hypothetical protein [Cohnella cholangitidis]QMV42137.1 hypothetical protein FPL14_13735 [Cohnella cholangitidis]
MIFDRSKDDRVNKAVFQLVFPFALEQDCQNRLRNSLLDDRFIAFELGDLTLENQFYGPDNRVSHRDMERYFLPLATRILFPNGNDPEAFRRLTKVSGTQADLVTPHSRIRFTVHSVDVVLCPFDTGFLTVRAEIDSADREVYYSRALEFGDRMRHLQDSNKLDLNTRIEHDGNRYDEVEDFVFRILAPHLLSFMDNSPMKDAHFEKLPFFMDERMFVIGFCALPEDADISLLHRYRAGRLDGLDAHGHVRVSASHIPYMEQYCKQFEYDRWAPNTYYLTDETHFICLTREKPDIFNRLANQMYGEYYYGLLLNLFHRIVLLKLSIAYSRAQLDRKQEHTKDLIRDITCFSAKYYFVELVAHTQGREIFHRLRSVYGNDELFDDVKQTLNDLYKYQETRTSKQFSYLLTILTIYTVISGIYGMNQVIDDLEGNFNWSFLSGYSAFQWIAFAVTCTGLTVAFLLILSVLWSWGRDFVRRWRS